MIVGAQMFTLREYAKTTEDLSESLKKVADMGYRSVQLSGVCEYEAEWMKEELRKNGLTCSVTHTKPDKILADVEQVCRDHKTIGCNKVGIGMMPGKVSDETYAQFVADFSEPIRKIHDLGMKFFYHNHQIEFVRNRDGKLFIDQLCEDFAPEYLGITFDTYWAQFAGCDPAAWLYRLKGRVECVHLKDMIAVGKEHIMMPVGSGNMNFERILQAAADVGTEHVIVEQDHCYDEDPFDCLKKSLDYLRACGLSD